MAFVFDNGFGEGAGVQRGLVKDPTNGASGKAADKGTGENDSGRAGKLPIIGAALSRSLFLSVKGRRSVLAPRRLSFDS